MVEKQAIKREKFPLIVQSSAASVKIHRVRTGPGGAYEEFTVADYGSGSRRLRKFAKLSE